ncbi:MAG: hydrogenase maturation protease [Phycisphaerales bacterium]
MNHPRDIIVIGFGNPARADDGLGPALVRALEREPIDGVAATWDFQPAVEHAADVAEHRAVIFADASRDAPEPFSFTRPLPRADEPFSTHALRPEHVAALASDALGWRGAVYVLAIRGYSFDAFEERLTPRAHANLYDAVDALRAALEADDVDARLKELLSARNGAPCPTTRS